MKTIGLIAGFILSSFCILHAQSQQKIRLRIQQGEYWFGGAVNEGENMPFMNGYQLNLYGDNRGNQACPFLLSSKGRFVWSEEPFQFEIDHNYLNVSGKNSALVIDNSGKTLRDAFVRASKLFFPPSGKLPDTLLFCRPQYNTWIELTYNQNQKDILKYAHSIISNGFPPGVLMIDDNWAPYYGKFEFRKDRFPDAAQMIKELHSMGFKVMLWVCPFISPDTEVFRELNHKKVLLADNDSCCHGSMQLYRPALINWWNGYSAVLDFTNPDAIDWYSAGLRQMVNNYGVDGFKFDAGDMEYYPQWTISYKKATPNQQCELWGLFGLQYPLNEYRAMWKRGGQPLVERLRDKKHDWADLQKLIPDIIAAGLLGYQFTCPDMVGGGEYGSFLDKEKLDQQLVVRFAQVSALMPMMQFSAAPWRVLDTGNLDAVKKVVMLRMKFTPYIKQLMQEAAVTGEPVVRSLEYVFPGGAYEKIKDQFMLGDKYMIAPMMESGLKRKVIFPKGLWKGDDGSMVGGPIVKEIKVPIDRLPVYELMKSQNTSF